MKSNIQRGADADGACKIQEDVTVVAGSNAPREQHPEQPAEIHTFLPLRTLRLPTAQAQFRGTTCFS